jgi:hypothetical protein
MIIGRTDRVLEDVFFDQLQYFEGPSEAKFCNGDPDSAPGLPSVSDVVEEGGCPIGGMGEPGRGGIRRWPDVPAAARSSLGIGRIFPLF